MSRIGRIATFACIGLFAAEGCFDDAHYLTTMLNVGIRLG
jgi:hypothetical protein